MLKIEIAMAIPLKLGVRKEPCETPMRVKNVNHEKKDKYLLHTRSGC